MRFDGCCGCESNANTRRAYGRTNEARTGRESKHSRTGVCCQRTRSAFDSLSALRGGVPPARRTFRRAPGGRWRGSRPT
eukprot:6391679-Pyramimonas_sp.AAC.1